MLLKETLFRLKKILEFVPTKGLHIKCWSLAFCDCKGGLELRRNLFECTHATYPLDLTLVN